LPQCHVLLELSFATQSLSALAATLDLDKSTLSRTVDGLVRAGMVVRAEEPKDRRSLRLELSPAGRERVRTIDALCNAYYARLFGRMSGADQQQIERAVRLLAGAMAKCAPSLAGPRPAVPMRTV